MLSVEYLHSSFSGTFPIPCEILEKKDDDFYVIKFIDPYFGTIEQRSVRKSDLVFPKFADIAIP